MYRRPKWVQYNFAAVALGGAIVVVWTPQFSVRVIAGIVVGCVILIVATWESCMQDKAERADLLRERRVAKGLCMECGYSRQGNTSGRCPKCGALI